MNKKVDAIIENSKDALIKSIQESIRFPSVEGEPKEGAPFGEAVNGALEHALNLGREMGFSVTNLDGYAGCIDYGEGEDMLGVVCHLDVVPEGEGWLYPPYAAEIHDGKIYGRGALDDKGPAICAMYALKAIKEAGLPMRRRVRIILGTNEETGWGCMNHYKKVAEIPTLTFSPDADYPLVNSEKGIYHPTFKCGVKTNIRVSGGTRANVVCGKAEVFAPLPAKEVEKQLHIATERGMSVEIKEENGGTKLLIIGQDAHGSMPEHGKNAMQAAFAILASLPLEGEDKRTAEALYNAFKFDMHGESMGIDRTDSSGRLTLNLGVIAWDEEGFELAIDVRHPTSMAFAEVREAIEKALAPLKPVLTHEKQQDGHFIPEDSELVSKLLKVYEARTGKREAPLAIGGGTYARAFPNAVAFGCEKPGISGPIHMPNEYLGIDEAMFDTHMIADAIIALACEE
ncbi:MAG: dipeptidase PepV [Clostridia bacterium]|nr:dipeptidase PepV [Clostridia bacterium]